MLLELHKLHPFKNQTRPLDKKSKVWLLYRGIAEHKYQTDEEAFQALYGEELHRASYMKLKNDLQAKLLDSVLSLNFSGTNYTDFQKAYYETHKEWVTIRYLIGHNVNTAGMILANKLLRLADKFDFTLLCLDISSYMRIQYSLRDSNDKRFISANESFNHYFEIYEKECLAEELYTSLIALTVNKRASNKKVNIIANEHFSKIWPLMQQFQSYRLQMNGFMIGLIKYSTENDFSSGLELCDKAIELFSTRPYQAKVPLQIFYYQNVIFHLQLKQADKADYAINKCIELLEPGTFNWFKFYELYLTLLIHKEDYEGAGKILNEALTNTRFEFLPDNAKELWLIYGSYMNYLNLIGVGSQSDISKFRLAKFINEVPIFSKDKSGMNIAIIIIKYLYLLLEKKYSKIIDDVESIDQYCYRHLRGPGTRKSFVFIKLLLLIPNCNFDKDQIIIKAQSYLWELRISKTVVVDQMHEIEIVPYERLWGFALNSIFPPETVA